MIYLESSVRNIPDDSRHNGVLLRTYTPRVGILCSRCPRFQRTSGLDTFCNTSAFSIVVLQAVDSIQLASIALFVTGLPPPSPPWHRNIGQRQRLHLLSRTSRLVFRQNTWPLQQVSRDSNTSDWWRLRTAPGIVCSPRTDDQTQSCDSSLS